MYLGVSHTSIIEKLDAMYKVVAFLQTGSMGREVCMSFNGASKAKAIDNSVGDYEATSVQAVWRGVRGL